MSREQAFGAVSSRSRIVVAVAALCGLLGAAPVLMSGTAHAATGDLVLASTSDAGLKGNRPSESGSLSADGTKVAFSSQASNLDPADGDGGPTGQDVFVKNLVTGDVTLVSTGDTGVKGNGSSSGPSISADGRRVAFSSQANNFDPSDTDTSGDVYVKDLVTGEITLASTTSAGVKGNFTSGDPVLSSDGLRVSFSSGATNLAPEDGSSGEGLGVYDAFVKDLVTGHLTWVSRESTTLGYGAQAFEAALSGNGMKVAFAAYALWYDVWVYDLTSGTLTRASSSDGGTRGSPSSSSPSMSADGRLVTFSSLADNLDPSDTDRGEDIYVKDLVSGDVRLVSTTHAGTKSNGASDRPAISAGGTAVAFESRATNLSPDDADTNHDIYVKDLQTGELALASASDAGVKGNFPSSFPSLSADGNGVVFRSTSTNLDPADTNSDTDTYVKQLSSDRDGDGMLDGTDNCPDAANPDQADNDSDGHGDACDPDDDNDGIPDSEDAFPFDADESVDTDGDGIGNNADPDDDGDGQSDADELSCGSDPLSPTSTSPDADGDGRPDCADPDDDNDGIPDSEDAFPFDADESVDTDGDGIGNNADPDDDGDGQSDADELSCGSDPLSPTSTSPDADGDGRPDCADPDDDNDGIPDSEDAFPFDADESVDTDGDGIGNNADPDDDGDGQSDADELSCGSDPLSPTSTSPDADGDGRPDCADPDDDNDGVLDDADNCPAVANPDQADHDGDGQGDACDATPSGRGLVFSSARSGNGDIYTVNADGTGERQLTTGSAVDAEPAWSPDGSRIAFTSSRSGNGDIYVMSADGGAVTRLTFDGASEISPAWSPDGTRIAFATNRHGGSNFEIYEMAANGGGQKRLTVHTAADTLPAWSPDGSKIAFTSTRTGDGDIYVMNADGTATTRVTTQPRADVEPAWSPDGTRLAFATNRHGGANFEIYVISPNGAAPTRLTTNTAGDIQPAWSPDGTRIAFATNRYGSRNYELYTMTASGAAPHRLTANPAADLFPDW